jgi:hypothetical protein
MKSYTNTIIIIENNQKFLSEDSKCNLNHKKVRIGQLLLGELSYLQVKRKE